MTELAEKIVNIKYECMHPSCQVFCKKGFIPLEEGAFKQLSSEAETEGEFRSPQGACRMGFSQTFKAVEVSDYVERDEDAAPLPKVVDESNPLSILAAEHEGVLEKLDKLEHCVKTRDLDGLWEITALVENDILLHSIKKEEMVLFPKVKDRIPMGLALIGIMDEDHREFISLLHGFRYGLQFDEILDGLVNSLIVNLRNHIRKENEEFFPMAEEHLTNEEKVEIIEAMQAMEKGHINMEIGDRSKKELEQIGVDREELDSQISALKVHSSVGGEEMCCGEH
jgi:hemerythrin-like domain-containing protein